MATVAPIKVDAETDRLISHAAHFLGTNKKAIVDEAVREYIDAHRDEINQAVLVALKQIDGTKASMVSVLTGLSREELDELGGVPEA
ncbi:hypothetical protein [Sinomonas sp. P10A9]|uniref:Uncharacterized protein n=1 Tax=Sinomonas puerhi TaxID=3238584 RepID=A0AB39L293_9MICC